MEEMMEEQEKDKTECIETWFIHNESYMARFIENGIEIKEK